MRHYNLLVCALVAPFLRILGFLWENREIRAVAARLNGWTAQLRSSFKWIVCCWDKSRSEFLGEILRCFEVGK